MMNAAKRVFCLVRVAAHLADALVRVVILFPWFSPTTRRRHLDAWSRQALGIFGLKLVVVRDPERSAPQPNLLVANHVSWLDIFAIWAATDTVFVAKSDVGRWPVIGLLARRLNVIFVDRAKRSDVISVGRAISDTLKNGQTVCIFPEGTTTEGRELRSFRTALFQPAIDQAVSIQPLAIRYFRADGLRAKEAAFVGDMSLGQSMWGLAAGQPITIDLSFLPNLSPEGRDRRILAKLAEDLVREALFDPAPDLEPASTAERSRSGHAKTLDVAAYPTP
jgi:1-acyl-sn-glycerol-3-phosphate acyltransferase